MTAVPPPHPLQDPPSPWYANATFLLGVCIALVFRTGLVGITYMERELPAEFDDAFFYIFRAILLNSYLGQPAKAIQDLIAQSNLASHDPVTHANISLDYFYFYWRHIGPPLYSVLLDIMHALGFPWITAYQVLGLASIVGITLMVGWLLYHLFGPGAAGIGMILFSVRDFPVQGLSQMVPGNFTLLVVFLSWILIIRYRFSKPWWLVAGLIVMVSLHHIGQIYGAIALAVALWMDRCHLSRERLLATLACVVVIVFPFIEPYLGEYPYRFSQLFTFDIGPEWQGWSGIQKNFAGAGELILKVGKDFGGVVLIALMLLFSLVTLSRERLRILFPFLAACGGALLVGLFYVSPARIPGDLFIRLWLPFLVLLLGLLGHGGWTLMEWIIGQQQSRGRTLLALGMSLIFVWGGVNYARQSYWSLLQKAKVHIDRLNHSLEALQPEWAVSHTQPEDTIVYSSLDLMRFYMFYGALGRGAIYAKTLAGTSDEIQWITNNKTLRYFVAWNPLLSVLGSFRTYANHFPLGGLLIAHRTELQIASDTPLVPSAVQLLFDNRGAPGFLHLDQGATGMVQVEIPGRRQKWLALPATAVTPTRNIALSFIQPDGLLLLKGIRVDNETLLNWPWDKGISIQYDFDGGHQPANPFHFSVKKSLPVVPGHRLRVIRDGGSAMLMELTAAPPEEVDISKQTH